MAKKEIIALLAEGGALRGVRFAPHGRETWIRTAGGVWPLPPAGAEAQSAEVGAASPPSGWQGLPTPAGADAQTADAGAAPPVEGENPAAGEVAADDTPFARALAAARAELGGPNVVVALPLARLLTRIVRMPAEAREELSSAVALQMDKLSPFPGEEQSIGWEVLCETEKDLWVFAAAMPTETFKEIADSMRLAKLRVIRTDVAILGWYRSLCGPCKLMNPGRRALLLDPDGVWDLMVLDQGVPILARGLGVSDNPETVVRELILSIMNAELDAGVAPLEEILVVSSREPSESLLALLGERLQVPVRYERLKNRDGGVEGVALRTGENSAMDLTPQWWRNELRDQTIRKRVVTVAGIAAAVWAVGMGALFAGPVAYRQMTQHVRKQARQHAQAFKRVADTRERVNLILSYTDRTYSALELLRILSQDLPEGVTLTAVTYKRADGIKLSGMADQPTMVYDFKNAVTENPLFASVTLTGPSASKGKHKFDINAVFKSGEKEKKK